MGSTNALAETLTRTADELAELDAKMTPAPWMGFRTGGGEGIPESAMVSTGPDRWVAFPNEELAIPMQCEHGGVTSDFTAFPKAVYERVHPDCLGIADARNRLPSLSALLRLAAAEIERMTRAKQ
jgi:hypothetical protein